MIVVGLTGGIGSGKTTIAKILKTKKIPVFDSDQEVSKLYKEKNRELIKVLKKIIDLKKIIKKNKIDKKLLGDFVFNKPTKLKILEKIIFKNLDIKRKLFLKKNKKNKKNIVVLDTPLLFENKINLMCDYVITTKAPFQKRLKRVLKRKGMTKSKALKIMKMQMSEQKKIKHADFVVQTSKGKCYTKKEVGKIINLIKKTK